MLDGIALKVATTPHIYVHLSAALRCNGFRFVFGTYLCATLTQGVASNCTARTRTMHAQAVRGTRE